MFVRDETGVEEMRIPTLEGVVERRLLINYRLDKDLAAELLPAPFEPHLVNGFAVAGICLIRLGQLRPRGIPARLGLASENAAHRIAVCWGDETGPRSGVYIPTRHSSAAMNVLVGDRLFPGLHHRADFDVSESDAAVKVAFASRNLECRLDASVTISPELAGSELFSSTDDASTFFQMGSAGFSPSRRSARLNGLELRAAKWHIEPTTIEHVRSSFYDDRDAFPVGKIHLDSALVMRNIPVEWHGIEAPDLCEARPALHSV